MACAQRPLAMGNSPSAWNENGQSAAVFTTAELRSQRAAGDLRVSRRGGQLKMKSFFVRAPDNVLVEIVEADPLSNASWKDHLDLTEE